MYHSISANFIYHILLHNCRDNKVNWRYVHWALVLVKYSFTLKKYYVISLKALGFYSFRFPDSYIEESTLPTLFQTFIISYFLRFSMAKAIWCLWWFSTTILDPLSLYQPFLLWIKFIAIAFRVAFYQCFLNKNSKEIFLLPLALTLALVLDQVCFGGSPIYHLWNCCCIMWYFLWLASFC